MKAIRVYEFGGTDVLKLKDMPDPQPAAGQVVVATHAIGVNPVDTYIRRGNMGLGHFHTHRAWMRRVWWKL